MSKQNTNPPRNPQREREIVAKHDEETEPDWTKKCEICGQSPIVPCTGMCGPCTFGEAETMYGNW
jgi:hypothetical protein